MWATQRALKFKVLQSGSECDEKRKKKKTGQGSKKTLCFGDWLCQKEFLLEDSKRLAGGWRGSWGRFWGEMWITASERKKSAKVCWGPLLWQCHGPFSGTAALRLHGRDFFIYFFNFMPCRPLNGPTPSPKTALSPFVAGHPNPLSWKWDA